MLWRRCGDSSESPGRMVPRDALWSESENVISKRRSGKLAEHRSCVTRMCNGLPKTVRHALEVTVRMAV